MRRICNRLLAVCCALAMAFTLLPVTADAAAKPKFAKNYTALYENKSNDGVYTYTVKNLSKGQKVKWSVSGTGKSYVKLGKKTTSVSKTTSSNKLTVKTKGKTAAKNKTVVLTAKVYSKAGKLQYTLKTKTAKLKVMPTDIAVVQDGLSDLKLYVGDSYQFQYQITPANATSSNTWTAMDARGNYVTTMSKSGKFTPDAEGSYTVTVQAKIGSKVIASDSTTVTVLTAMTDAHQTAANQIVAVYSGNASDLVKKSSFTVRNASGAKNEVKDIAFSADGTEVTLTTYDLFKDGTSYTVSDGQSEYEFTASVGKPTRMALLTTDVTVNKETPIEYAVYDANGINVLAAYPGDVTYEEKITNGYRTKDNKLYMTTIGATGTLTLTYKCTAEPTIVLSCTGTVTCTAASTSANTNLTLTASETAPDYSASDYKDNRTVAAGSNYYVHFRALDTDGTAISYDSVKFESTEPDTLLVNNKDNNTAKATAIKSGQTTLIVTAVYAGQTYTYTYEITVSEPAYLAVLTADQTTLSMSNVNVSGYKGYVKIQAKDQYGQSLALTDETAQITETGTVKGNMATYDAAADRLVIDAAGHTAGTYAYTLTLTMGGYKASVGVTVVVQTPPVNGASSYRAELDQSSLDLAVSSGMSAAELQAKNQVTVRLAEYRGGVFYDYMYFQSAAVKMGGKYYKLDLTSGGLTADPSIGSGNTLTLQAVSINGSTVAKAQTGTYTVELKYYPTGGSTLTTASATLRITDSQTSPQIAVDRTVSTSTCKNALELAKNCLSVQGVTGTITGCTVTGSDKSGADYTIASGESVNIKAVTVEVTTTLSDGTSVSSSYTVSVGKTLKNA